MQQQYILYGLSGARTQYRALANWVFYGDKQPTTSEVRLAIGDMLDCNPSIRYVFLISNRSGLKREYEESYKKNTIESCAVFKDTLEREGLQIVI